VPTETFSVIWPRLSLESSPTRLAGAYTPAADGPVVLEILLPSGLRGGAIAVSVDGQETPAAVEGDIARFTLQGRAEVRVGWAVTAP
jgi:hypothetical protein